MIRRGLKLIVAVFLSGLALVTITACKEHDSGYSHDSSIDTSDPDWMKDFPDFLLLSELSIPGTHDTMARCGDDVPKCQTLKLEQQLDAGIRALDIRARKVGYHFDITHNCQQSGDNCWTLGDHYEFDDVLCKTVQFLDANPKETVLMRVQDAGCPLVHYRSFEETYLDYVENQGCESKGEQVYFRDYIWKGDYSTVPTLGEVRGKIVVFDNFEGGHGNYGLKWEDTIIQDYFDLVDIWKLVDKWTEIRKHLEKTDIGDPNKIYINFLSAYPGGSYPYFVASGHSSPGTSDPHLAVGKCVSNCSPYWRSAGCCYFIGTNDMTLDYIANGNVKNRTGILMMDFPSSLLIEAIIGVNYLNTPPEADANGPYVGFEGTEINFGANFLDTDGDQLVYTWDFDSDGNWDILSKIWSAGQMDSYTWYDDWQGAATVQVSDGKSSATDTAMVTINNVAPAITAAGSVINENSWAIVSGSITDPGTQDTFSIEINWGEGPPQTYSYPAGTTAYSEQHQYLDDNPTDTSSDIYPVTVMVTDDDGGSSNTSTTVTVNNVVPEVSIDLLRDETGAVIGSDILVVLEDLVVEFDGSFTDVGDQDTHTATVEWGDGSSNDLGSVVGSVTYSHIYANPGIYEMRLSVTDDDRGVGTSTFQIMVVDATEGINVVIEELLALSGDSNVAAALNNLRGENGGNAENGALDMLNKGNLNAALEKIGQAMQSLEIVDLPYIKKFLTLTSKSAIMGVIEQIEATAVRQNDLRKIQEAKDLVAQGDSLLATSDYVGAVVRYQQAVRKVQGLK